MKRKLSTAIAIAALAPLSSIADVTVYGKANVSIESVTDGDDSYTNISSNASRLGFKGSEKVNDSVTAVYKLEYEVFVDDGDNKGSTFAQRNIYVGLEGGFGTALIGRMDTPLKSAQNKIDLFGDLHGDIKNMLTKNENRESNTVMYTTPTAGGFSASALYMSREKAGDTAAESDGASISVSWNNDAVYLALAHDSGIEGEDKDATRFVGQFTFGSVQLGALYETLSVTGGDDLNASFVSLQYKANKDWALKAQYGQSDQVETGGDTLSVGADYKLSKNCTLFGFHTINGADNDVVDASYTGLGMELKF